MLRESVRCEAGTQIEAGVPAGDHIEDAGSGYAPQHLNDDIGNQILRRKSAAEAEAYGYRGIEVTAGDVTDRVSHGQDGEAKRKRDTDEPDAQRRERRRQHGAAAAPKDEPKSTDEFRNQA